MQVTNEHVNIEIPVRMARTKPAEAAQPSGALGTVVSDMATYVILFADDERLLSTVTKVRQVRIRPKIEQALSGL